MDYKLKLSSTDLFFLPDVAVMGSDKKNGLLRHSSFDTPQVLALLLPRRPMAVYAERVASWHKPEDEAHKQVAVLCSRPGAFWIKSLGACAWPQMTQDVNSRL